MGHTVNVNAGVLDTMLAKDNGYPIEFRVVNVFDDAFDGKYFPATIAHIVAIRNMTDEELETNAAAYNTMLIHKENRIRPVVELVNALIKIAEDEWDRRTAFKSKAITLQDYYPETYIGNVPKVAS